MARGAGLLRRPGSRSVVVAVVIGLVASGAGLAVLARRRRASALVVLAGLIKRMATRYVITSERLQIRRGILSKKTQETRVQRVQNVNTDQSFFERILQVGTVDFDTAGTDDSEFRFIGVSEPRRRRARRRPRAARRAADSARRASPSAHTRRWRISS